MRPTKVLLFTLLTLCCAHMASTRAADEPLAFDALMKEYNAKPGEEAAHFFFGVTNISQQEVVIDWVRTSCGCTVAKLPSQPWVLAPGANGQVGVDVDLHGKFGTLTKIVTVNTVSAGPKLLTIKVNIPQGANPQMTGLDSRVRNMQIAQADRQAVFKGECASCHVLPTVNKTGEALYLTACAVCHDSPHRATMVPDLRALKTTPTRDYWTLWVCYGRSNSLMPAFAKSEGGPLDENQIKSLVDYLSNSFPPGTKAASLTPVPASLSTPVTQIPGEAPPLPAQVPAPK